jgi:hypothetical protein
MMSTWMRSEAMADNEAETHAEAAEERVRRLEATFESVAQQIDREWREKGGLNCTEVCAIVRSPIRRGAGADAEERPAAWREIDLSKAVKHDHPDIVPNDKTYLVKIHGGWFFGPFTRQWYGLSFSNWGWSGAQFDAPGWNSSKWERVIEIDPEALSLPAAEDRADG